jgi:hypothetical protein
LRPSFSDLIINLTDLIDQPKILNLKNYHLKIAPSDGLED